MTHRSEEKRANAEALLDAIIIRERDQKLVQLAQSGDYRQALAEATEHPKKLWSFPLLMAALQKARNVPIDGGANGLSDHLADRQVLFPRLRRIADQPYAYTVLCEIVGWAPREVLSNADSFANQPYAADIIARAMKVILDIQAAQESTYPQLPPTECLKAISSLGQDQLTAALKQPLFAQGLRRYKAAHDAYYNKRSQHDIPAETAAHYRNLEGAFIAAEQMSSRTPEAIQGPPILVLSSPSAGGKTSQRRLLLADHPKREFLVSCTTREPRPGEQDGIDYHFLRLGRTDEETRNKFSRLVKAGEIFEHTDCYGHRYGTPKKQLEEGLANGKQLIADVNLEGFNSFKRAYPDQTLGFFLEPPSLQVIQQRLERRIVDEKNISPEMRQRLQQENQQRLAAAVEMMRNNEKIHYDAVLPQGTSPAETYELLKQALQPAATISGQGAQIAGVTTPAAPAPILPHGG